MPLPRSTFLWAGLAVAVLAAGYMLMPDDRGPDAGATAAAPGEPIVQVAEPGSLEPLARLGQTAFDANCATCHGPAAAGREGKGPPLVHRYYEPSHHGDAAFQLAVEQGVRAHHWRFGDMPPVEGLLPQDVASITAYVRALQRANGIY